LTTNRNARNEIEGHIKPGKVTAYDQLVFRMQYSSIAFIDKIENILPSISSDLPVRTKKSRKEITQKVIRGFGVNVLKKNIEKIQKSVVIILRDELHKEKVKNLHRMSQVVENVIDQDVTYLSKIPGLRLVFEGNPFNSHMYTVGYLTHMFSLLSTRENTSQRIGALLHDIGKEILFGPSRNQRILARAHFMKPYTFTQDDHDVGKRHPILASKVIDIGKRMLNRYFSEVDWCLVQEIQGGHHDGVNKGMVDFKDERVIQFYFRDVSKRFFDSYWKDKGKNSNTLTPNFTDLVATYKIVTTVELADWLSGLYLNPRNYNSNNASKFNFVKELITNRFSPDFIIKALRNAAKDYNFPADVKEEDKEKMFSYISNVIIKETKPLVKRSLIIAKDLPFAYNRKRIEIPLGSVSKRERSLFTRIVLEALELTEDRMQRRVENYSKKHATVFAAAVEYASLNDSTIQRIFAD